MALIAINRQPSRRQLKQFGLLFFPAFVLMLGWILLKATGSLPLAGLCWSLGVLSIALALASPRRLRTVWLATMYATYPIGFLISHLVIAVAYYLILTPAGLLIRLFRSDPMRRAWDPKADSYWLRRPSEPNMDRYFRQF